MQCNLGIAAVTATASVSPTTTLELAYMRIEHWQAHSARHLSHLTDKKNMMYFQISIAYIFRT